MDNKHGTINLSLLRQSKHAESRASDIMQEEVEDSKKIITMLAMMGEGK
jgi:hypothetical protein